MNKLPIMLVNKSKPDSAAGISQQERTVAVGGHSAQASCQNPTAAPWNSQGFLRAPMHTYQDLYLNMMRPPASILNFHANEEILKQPNLHRSKTWGSSKDMIFNFKRIPNYLMMSPTETQRQHPHHDYRNYYSSSWQKKQNGMVWSVRKQGEGFEINRS